MAKLPFPFLVISLDIGGTKIAGGVLLYQKESLIPDIVIKEKRDALAKEGGKIFVNNICDFAKHLKDLAKKNKKLSKYPIVAIGMGSAGRINKNTGAVETTTDNFPGYLNTVITKEVSTLTKLPSFALNDVQSHTLGEARWGAGKNIDNFVLLAIGTGIGGAAVVNGHLMLGTHGFAGELGHIQVCEATDIYCSCGKYGHLEAIASGTGIEQTYKRRTGKLISGSEISNLAYKGDKNAIYAIELAGRSLGSAIAMYLSVFDPEIIVVSGSVAKAGKIWQDALNTGFKNEVIDEISKNLNLVSAKLGDDAALVGAAEYAKDLVFDLN